MTPDPKLRFTDRVENYKKYRPGYPVQLAEILLYGISKPEEYFAADIGSGTGIFTRILLDRNINVFAVEPNEAMRKQSESDLQKYPRFFSINASAEHTSLADDCVSLITVCQALHWFDIKECKHEFSRILNPQGRAAVIWNTRQTSTPFMIGFESLLNKCSLEYKIAGRKKLSDEIIADLFSSYGYESHAVPYYQVLSIEGLIGRVLSSSYAPPEKTPEYDVLLQGLKELFFKHQRDDVIEFVYETNMYLGRPG